MTEANADDDRELARIEKPLLRHRVAPLTKNGRRRGIVDISISASIAMVAGSTGGLQSIARHWCGCSARCWNATKAAFIGWQRRPNAAESLVDDAPFLAVAVERRGEADAQALIFRTNIGDFVTADADHPLRVETDPATQTPRPYILFRNRLEARLARPVFYDLVEWGVEERVGETTRFGVWSKGTFFPLDPPARD